MRGTGLRRLIDKALKVDQSGSVIIESLVRDLAVRGAYIDPVQFQRLWRVPAGTYGGRGDALSEQKMS